MSNRLRDLSSRIYDAIVTSPENDPNVVVAAVHIILCTLVVELEIPEDKAIEQFQAALKDTKAIITRFGWDWPHNSDEVH